MKHLAALYRRPGQLALQLSALLLLISVLPLLLYYAVSYRAAEKTILEQASRHSLQTLRNQRDVLQLHIDQVESLAANLSQSEELVATLGGASGTGSTYDVLATRARIGYLLSHHRNLRGLVAIDVFGLDGTRYHVGDTLAQSRERSDLRDELLERTMRSRAFVTWHGVEDNVEKFSGVQKVLAASHMLMGAGPGQARAEPVGMLLISISTVDLHERLSRVSLGEGASLLVLDQRRRLIHHPDAARIGQAVTPEFAALLRGPSGSFTQRLGGEEVLLSYEALPDQDWVVVSIVPQHTLLASMAELRRVAGVMLVLMVAVILVLLRLFAMRIVEPIAAIAQGFRDFRLERIAPGWRMPRPRSLQPIVDLAQWFNAFLEGMEQRAAAQGEIAQLAFYDPLTGLPNRRLLIDRLRQAMPDSARRHQSLALMFLDLDKFKTLNDTLGHDAGDALLRQVAERLKAGVRVGDTVARLGGDEFVVLLQGLDADRDAAAAQAQALGTRLLRALAADYALLADSAYRCSASIGVAVHGGGGSSGGGAEAPCSLEELMKQADIALYQAKEAGRNTLRFFEPAMQARLLARTALEHSLRQALADAQFRIHLQPKVDGCGRIVGAEALVRWQRPGHGAVPPQEFITLAEETGLILPLGEAVLRQACAQLVAWSADARRAHLGLAVNVSPREFRQADFVAQVLRVLRETGADPARLTLEITESLFVDDVADVVAKMEALRRAGIAFALDDFGTGYSSLAYLKRMPLRELKIDRSFVRDVLSDANDATIARAVIALGHELGLEVVAEGIETEAQLEFLQANGCRLFQGWLFGKAMAVEEFEALLEREAAATAGATATPSAQRVRLAA
ncbi:putative bifunctional diguanylate cyclase/phosphodiesterase [Azohydromonas aeria]|uniref:putative bifunctional diguanylate cyclase/phosphodiesterase n=1 Tax=Azohydromonas aeria TaxID=2590212 RepID=UPI0012FA0468|nr:EAL domain-containing protein [Azohydromonas aeria]